MPRYYFEVRDGADSTPDHEGLDLPDVAAAEREAMTAAGGIASDHLRRGNPRDVAIGVYDRSRRHLLTVTVSTRVDRH